MTNLNNHSTSNTSEEPELSMEELDAKWDALENDPEFLAKPFWQKIIEIGNVVPQSEKMRKNNKHRTNVNSKL